MIYSFPSADAPPSQGDIFFPLPLAVPDIIASPVRFQSGERPSSGWLANADKHVAIEVNAPPVWALLLTQDCDALRSPVLTFCKIRPVAGTGIDLPSQPRKRWRRIVKEFKANPHLFYLPKDERVGFTEPMAAAFGQLLQIPLDNVMEYRGTLRKGRLNDTALIHLRERLAFFFTRLAYDETYAFDSDERAAYEQDQSEERGPR